MSLDQGEIGLIAYIGTCFAGMGWGIYGLISELNHEKIAPEKRAGKT